jgi:hypothetical protein
MSKVSDCCGVGPFNEQGICPSAKCREHCEWVDEDEKPNEEPTGEPMNKHGTELEQKWIAKTGLGHADYVDHLEKMLKSLQACPICGQRDVGQHGEYPCEVCGLPAEWADEEHMPSERYAEMQRLDCGAVPVRTSKCMGKNCGCTDGQSHSPECIAEHEYTIDQARHFMKCTKCGVAKHVNDFITVDVCVACEAKGQSTATVCENAKGGGGCTGQ